LDPMGSPAMPEVEAPPIPEMRLPFISMCMPPLPLL
jgi:hypothetical protein